MSVKKFSNYTINRVLNTILNFHYVGIYGIGIQNLHLILIRVGNLILCSLVEVSGIQM